MNDQIDGNGSSLKNHIKCLKVLIVNDEYFILNFQKMMVSQLGINKIDFAQNGYDCYQMAL